MRQSMQHPVLIPPVRFSPIGPDLAGTAEGTIVTVRHG